MPRTKPRPLTPMFLRHVKPPLTGQVEHADGACPGLRLRLSIGTTTWVLGCRDAAGRARRFPLGSYPEIGLAAAREAARDLRAEVRKGHDPIAEARQRRREAQQDASADGEAGGTLSTLVAVLDAYGKAVGASRRSWPRARGQVANVFGKLFTRPANEITATELQLVTDAHASAASAGAAVRYLKPLLKWAAKRGHMSTGIAAALDQPEGAQRVRQRVLSRDEVRAILCTVDGFAGHGAVLRWLFLTGCRLNEACGMRWCDIDDERALWTIAQTKQGGTHTVPLPRQAMALLREQPGECETNGLVFANSVGNRLTHWDAVTKRIQAASGTAGWHRHDIRRTIATMLGDQGVAPHVIETVLGHVLRTSSDGSAVGRVAAVYNRSRYRTEHASALQRLADELDWIIEGDEARVVRLRA